MLNSKWAICSNMADFRYYSVDLITAVPSIFLSTPIVFLGLPWWPTGKELSSQCRRRKSCGFDPWVRKIPWRRAWRSTPVFLPGGSHGRLWSIRLQRVSRDLVTKQQPTTMDIFTKHIAAENKRYLSWLSSYCFISTLSCTWDSNYVRWKAPGSIHWELCY